MALALFVSGVELVLPELALSSSPPQAARKMAKAPAAPAPPIMRRKRFREPGSSANSRRAPSARLSAASVDGGVIAGPSWSGQTDRSKQRLIDRRLTHPFAAARDLDHSSAAQPSPACRRPH